jgi:fatty-acyl-CoA synthase
MTRLVQDVWRDAVARWPAKPALIVDGKGVVLKASFKQVDALANQFANWGLSLQTRKREPLLSPGDSVALMLPNRVEALAAAIGFMKIGVLVRWGVLPRVVLNGGGACRGGV